MSWEPSWLQVGGLGGHFGSKLGGLEAILAPSWGVLVPFCLQVEGSWLQVGKFWEHFGSKLGVKLAPTCHFAHIPKTLKNLRFFKVFGGFGGASWLQVEGCLGHFGSKIEDLGATWPLEMASWSNLAT